MESHRDSWGLLCGGLFLSEMLYCGESPSGQTVFRTLAAELFAKKNRRKDTADLSLMARFSYLLFRIVPLGQMCAGIG